MTMKDAREHRLRRMNEEYQLFKKACVPLIREAAEDAIMFNSESDGPDAFEIRDLVFELQSNRKYRNLVKEYEYPESHMVGSHTICQVLRDSGYETSVWVAPTKKVFHVWKRVQG